MQGVWQIATHYGTEPAKPPLGVTLAELSARQHGVVSLAQLGALGMSSSGVRSRVARGSLHRVHRGVYAVGHPLLPGRGRWMAAVLACGPGAALSHRTAAALWELRPVPAGRVDVTAPGRVGRGRPGIAIHSPATLAHEDVTVAEGIPCTCVARTLVDLADVVDREALERACERAEVLCLFDLRAVERVLARTPGRRGAAVLRTVVEAWRPEASRTRSELERRMLALCRTAGLPSPEPNAWLGLPGGGLEVDFLWRAQGLAVETDGRATHGTRAAFEDDRRRDQRLLMAGVRVARFTWRQTVERPEDVAATLAALLGRDR